MGFLGGEKKTKKTQNTVGVWSVEGIIRIITVCF